MEAWKRGIRRSFEERSTLHEDHRTADPQLRWGAHPKSPEASGSARPGKWSETGRVARDVAPAAAQVVLPARAGALGARGVEADARHLHEHVTGVGVDGHPLALARAAPVHEAARVARAGDQPGGIQREGHGPGAVIARVEEAAVAAAPLVRRA